MHITGTYAFPHAPARVWAAIYDPATLKACIPQCEQIEPVRPDFWLGSARVGIGRLTIPFTGEITLSEVTPPESYLIAITARSWVGSARGQARVRLTPEGNGTILQYDAEVHIGIKMLDRAMNMAEGVARELADRFFGRLADTMNRTS